MIKKKALILGALGQDGSIFIESSIEDYEIHCIVRPKTNIQEKISLLPEHTKKNIIQNCRFIQIDPMSDEEVIAVLQADCFDVICNFAAYSNVFNPWQNPKEVMLTNSIIPSNILHAMLKTKSKAKYVQASSSLIFGSGDIELCNEFSPRSPLYPYGIAKNAADEMIKEYRDRHSLNVCSAILFNHESERRSSHFLTRKVILAAERISNGSKEKLELNSLSSQKDMGFARDHVEAIKRMTLEKDPEDYVVGTGELISMETFVKEAFEAYGLDYLEHVKIQPSENKKNETISIKADIMKAKAKLGWIPRKFSAKLLIEEAQSQTSYGDEI